MPIPDELLPPSLKKNKKTDKSLNKSNDVIDVEKQSLDNISQSSSNQPPMEIKKNNWAPWAKRALPIFLFIILAFGISIAAVPSWRNAFNSFIAQWSPKADVLEEIPARCMESASLQIFCHEFSYGNGCSGTANPYAAASYSITTNILPKSGTIENYNQEDWVSRYVPGKCEGMPGYYCADTNLKAGDVINYKFTQGSNEVGGNNTFSSASIKKPKGASMIVTGYHEWGSSDPDIHESDCFDSNKSTECYFVGRSLSFVYDPGDKYNETSIYIFAGAPTEYFTDIFLGIKPEIALRIDTNLSKDKLLLKTNSDGKKESEKAQLNIKTFQPDYYPMPSKITLKAPESVKFYVDGKEYSETYTTPTNKVTELNLDVAATESGKFPIDIYGEFWNIGHPWNNYISSCYKNTKHLEITAYELFAEIKSENSNYESQKADPKQLEKWTLTDGYYQVPVSIPAKDEEPAKIYQALSLVRLEDKETALNGKLIKLELQFKGDNIPTDKSKVKIVDKDGKEITEMQTNDNGNVEAYIQSEVPAKVKLKATHDEFGQTATAISDDGVEFGENKSQVTTQTCPSGDQVQDVQNLIKLLEDQKTENPQSKNTINQNWFVKLKNNIKNYISKLFNKNIDKVYSQTGSGTVGGAEAGCIDNAAEIYPDNNKSFAVQVEPEDGEMVKIILPEYLDIVSTDPSVESDKVENKIRTIVLKADNKNKSVLSVETHLKGKNEAELKELVNKFPDGFDGDAEVHAYTYNTSNPDNKTEINFFNTETLENDPSLNKFHINVLANYPKITINKIKRTVTEKQTDGTEKEEQKEILFPIDYDYSKEPSADLKPYMYFDETEKVWKAKIYPGDEITENITYNHEFKDKPDLNSKLSDLENVGMYFYIPTDYSEITSSMENIKETDLPDVYKINYQSISKNKPEIIKIVFKVDERIDWKNKQTRLWSAIGNTEYKALSAKKSNEGKFSFIENDIWTNIKGHISGPYGFGIHQFPQADNEFKPVPGVTLGIYNDKDKLVYGTRPGSTTVEIVNMNQENVLLGKETFVTDDNGDYQFECDRKWLDGSELFKLKIFFDNTIMNIHNSKYPISIFNTNETNFHITTNKEIINFEGSNNEKYDIKIRKDNVSPDLEYPTKDKIISQVKASVDIWANIYYARQILDEKKLYDDKNDSVDFIITPEIECLEIECIMAGFSLPTDKILIGGDYLDINLVRTPHLELHEFGHYVQNKLGALPFLTQLTSHKGYANDNTNDSYAEGFASYFAILLSNMTNEKFNSDDYYNNYLSIGITPFFFVDKIKPIFDRRKERDETQPIAKNNKNHAVAQTDSDSSPYKFEEEYFENYMEEFSVAGLFNCLTGYCENRKAYNYYWLKPADPNSPDNKDFTLGNSPTKKIPFHDDAKVKALFDILRSKKPKNLKNLYDAYVDNGYFTNKNINEIGLDYLEQIYVMFGVWEDTQPDWKWQKFETRGTSGNHAPTWISNIRSYSNIGIRENRPLLYYNGSFIKLNFTGSDGSHPKDVKLLISGRYDYDNPSLANEYNFEDTSYASDDQTSYFSFPPNGPDGKIYIRAEGSSEYLVVNIDDYSRAISSTTSYDYFLSKNFSIDGSNPPSVEQIDQIEASNNPPVPEPVPTPTPDPAAVTPEIPAPSQTPSTVEVPAETPPASIPAEEEIVPVLTIIDDDGNETENTTGGTTAHITASGFTGATQADIYVDNKKVDSIKLVNGGEDGFGLKVKVPDLAPVGKNEIKITDNLGHTASANVNITSNKLWNQTTKMILIILLIAALIAAAIIVFYRNYSKPKFVV